MQGAAGGTRSLPVHMSRNMQFVIGTYDEMCTSNFEFTSTRSQCLSVRQQVQYDHTMWGQKGRFLTQGPVLLGGKEAATNAGAPAPDSSHSHLQHKKQR